MGRGVDSPLATKRKLRTVKSLRIVEMPTVRIDTSTMGREEVNAVYQRVAALGEVRVTREGTTISVICADPATFLHTYRSIERIIEDIV
jgi:hypothetical protein